MQKPVAQSRLYAVPQPQLKKTGGLDRPAEQQPTIWVQVPFDLDPVEGEAEDPTRNFYDVPFDFSITPDEEGDADHA